MHHRDVVQSLRSVGDLYSYSMPSSGIAGDLMLIRLHRRGILHHIFLHRFPSLLVSALAGSCLRRLRCILWLSMVDFCLCP